MSINKEFTATYKIFHNKTYRLVRKLVSPRYKHLFKEVLVSGFIFGDEEVILSSQMRKALKKA
ncbi:hypothetical protein [Paenibacillus periandrae]|uniref:hypothetical protein n=1 Tax=Paenibacillus periandrae TaxID=1761741 RepID=UPI001F092B2B|nr:hypothetical protein [Paenibacillus periandrae]